MINRPTRRGFITGCSAAIAGLAGARLGTLAFADSHAEGDVLIVIFLRGGADGLSLVVPLDGPDRGHYEAARPSLAVPTTGPGAALALNSQHGLHPAAAPLLDLFQDQRLAVVHGVGVVEEVNKSHFDAMQLIELGTPGASGTPSGWLTRHLLTAGIDAAAVMPSLAIGDLQPSSLLASLETVNLVDPSSFHIDNGPWLWRNAQRSALRAMYSADASWLHDAGVQAMDAIDIVQLNVSDTYVPSNGAVYPSGELGEQLSLLAQMIKLDLGLSVATVDIGGWDTHEGQGVEPGGFFSTLVAELAAGLMALYTDLDGASGGGWTSRLTVIVQSEFGRELHENADQGTEHGYGNLMLLLGGHVNGGLHGTWPGLAPGQLVDGTDVAVTTDYRRILSEVLIRRARNPSLQEIFPGYQGYSPLGVVQGEDLPLDSLFSDRFESGDLGAWSASAP